MKFTRRPIIAGTILLVLSGILVWYFRPKPAPAPLPAPVVEEEETITASGEIQAQEQVQLSFQTSGLMAWLGVSKGDRVKKGQALARLDTYTVERNLRNALIAYSKQRNEFDETKQVKYKNMEVTDALTDTVKRILQDNQYDLTKAVNDVEIYNHSLRLATIVSPIDGIVTSLTPTVSGVNVTPASAAITVSNPDSVRFVADVDEIDIPSISVGQKAKVILDAYPDNPIDTVVSSISFASITTTGGGTAYEVELPLILEGQRLLAGMNGEVEFEN